jgi:hypothetical protein
MARLAKPWGTTFRNSLFIEILNRPFLSLLQMKTYYQLQESPCATTLRHGKTITPQANPYGRICSDRIWPLFRWPPRSGGGIVRQERLKSDAREFDTEEKLRLIDYFLAHCSGGEDSTVGDIVGGFVADYPAYVGRFVTILNKKGEEYTKHRTIVRRLWAAGSLRKCQLLPAFAYASFCMKRSSIESEFSSWLKLVAGTMRATQKVQRGLEQLGTTLQHQASRVDASFVGPEAKSPQLMTLALASACTQAIDDIEQIQTRRVCLRTFTSQLSVLYRMARDQALGVDHLEHPRTSATDLACILPLLEQSITGSFPSRNYLKDYSPENLLKDVSRMREEETIGRIKSIAEKFERIMPGFRERIAFEPYDAIPKRPLTAHLPVDATEVLMLSEIHTRFRNIPQRELAWDQLSPLLEVVLQILRNPNLSNDTS